MDTTLEIKIGEALKTKGMTVCTAESCTGGLIASRITDVSGSSAYMLGGIVAYSNGVKMALLKVKEQTLIDYGAVSEQTAHEMAIGALRLLKTDYALSVTGIAGPGGGTETKPVGLTYIGLAGPDDFIIVNRVVWDGDRIVNKQHSADMALQMLLAQVDTKRASSND